MKVIRCTMALAAALLVVATASADEKATADLAMKMANCPMCKSMANYPELGPNLRPDIHATKTGYVSTFMVADAKVLPVCAKWDKDCETLMTDAAKLTPEEFGKQFCPVCVSMHNTMARKDVTMEMFPTAMGKVTVASSSTTEGTAALHAHVDLMKSAMAAMPMAMTEMMKNAKPKTATTGE